MIAYKFLEPGRVAPFTGFQWPVGEWVEAERVDPCRGGIHACRLRDLPIWMGPELWQIELGGDVVEQERKVVAARGRLAEQVTGWTDELRREFGRFCAERTRKRVGYLPVLSGFVADIDRFRSQGRIPIAAFAAARAAELSDGAAAYELERRVQAAWLADRLALGSIDA